MPPRRRPANPQDDALFAPPARPPGPQREALERTIRSWQRRRHLTGAESAAQLAFLRGLADQLDYSWSPGAARSYADALAAANPPAAPAPIDPHAAGLESQALAILADLETTDPESEHNPTEGAQK